MNSISSLFRSTSQTSPTEDSNRPNTNRNESLFSSHQPANAGQALAGLSDPAGSSPLGQRSKSFTLGEVGCVAVHMFNKLGGASPTISRMYNDPTRTEQAMLNLPATEENVSALVAAETNAIKNSPPQNLSDKAADLLSPMRESAAQSFVFNTHLGQGGIRQAHEHGYHEEVYGVVGNNWS